MEECKREEIIKWMEEIPKQAEESVKECGSSYRNIEILIDDILSMTHL